MKNNREISIYKNNLFKFFLGYIIVSALSLFFSINYIDGIFEWTKLSLFFIFLVLSVFYFQKVENLVSDLCLAISCLSFLINGIGLYQFYQLVTHHKVSHYSTYLIDATFANRNLFAEILLLTLPFVLFGVFKFKGILRIICSLSLLSSLFLITSTLTRAVWVGLIVSSVLTLILYLFLRHRQENTSFLFHFRKVIFPIIIVLVSIMSAIFFYSRLDSEETFRKQISAISNINYGGANERIELWKKSFQIFKENPVAGVGLASWKIEVLKYNVGGTKPEDATTFYQYPHNDFVMVATEIGIIGLIFYLLIFAAIFYYIIVILKNTKTNEQFFYFLVFSGVVSFIVVSCFSFPKERIEQNIFLMFMFIPVMIKYHSIKNNGSKDKLINQNKTSGKWLFFLVVFLILIAFSIFIGLKRIKSDIHTLKALDAKRKNNWQKMIIQIDKAFSPYYIMDPMSTPLEWYRGTAYFNMGRHEEALRDFEKAYKINPYHVHILNNLGTCFELKNDHEKAINYFNKALLINQTFEDVILNLSASYFNAGAVDSAYQTIRKINQNTINERYNTSLSVIVHAKFKQIKIDIENEGLPSDLINQQKNWNSRKLKLSKLNNQEFTNLYNETMKLKMNDYLDNINWMIRIHNKSIKNSISIEEQIFIDSYFIIYNEII
ncbi:MAG: O-antigen ligase family protein [Bacteroidetes bacterium]|nr:O-antigen ligase family protein [Bacteroidota bacterium]